MRVKITQSVVDRVARAFAMRAHAQQVMMEQASQILREYRGIRE